MAKKWVDVVEKTESGFHYLYQKFNIRIYIISIIAGLLIGLVTVPYRYLIVQSVKVRDIIYAHDYSWYIHIAIILGLYGVAMLLYLMIKKIPMITGSGIPQVEGYMCNRFSIKHGIWEPFLKLIGGIVGVGMGLSLGREGPSVQVGGYIGRLVAKWAKLEGSDKRFLTSSGAAAGLSSAFTAPLASTIFVHEEITKYESSRSTALAFLAAVPSGWIAKVVFNNNEYARMSSAMPDTHELQIMLLTFIALAFFLSVCGKIFNSLLLFFEGFCCKFKMPKPIYILMVILLTYALGFFIPDILAGGEPLIFKNAAVGGSIWLILLLLVIKLVYTPLCYSLGFPGGIFLPLLVIGALAGKLFCLVLCAIGLPYQDYSGFFMLMSMGSIFAVVVRSPITGLVLILEMTCQFTDFFYMIVLVALTFFISSVMKVQPVYDLLYVRLLPKDYFESTDKIDTKFNIFENSYFVGKSIEVAKVPEGTTIIQFRRDGTWIVDKTVPMEEGDLIQVEFESRVLEQAYRSYRVLCNE